MHYHLNQIFYNIFVSFLKLISCTKMSSSLNSPKHLSHLKMINNIGSRTFPASLSRILQEQKVTRNAWWCFKDKRNWIFTYLNCLEVRKITFWTSENSLVGVSSTWRAVSMAVCFTCIFCWTTPLLGKGDEKALLRREELRQEFVSRMKKTIWRKIMH